MSFTSLRLIIIIHINPHNFPGILSLRWHEIEIWLHVLRRPVLPLIYSTWQGECVAVHVTLRISASGPLQGPGVTDMGWDSWRPCLRSLNIARNWF